MVGFFRVARAEFEQGGRSAELAQSRRYPGQNASLSTGWIIFRLFGNFLVQFAAAGIVKKTAFQRARKAMQAGRDRMGEIEGRSSGVGGTQDDIAIPREHGLIAVEQFAVNAAVGIKHVRTPLISRINDAIFSMDSVWCR